MGESSKGESGDFLLSETQPLGPIDMSGDSSDHKPIIETSPALLIKFVQDGNRLVISEALAGTDSSMKSVVAGYRALRYGVTCG